MRLEDFEPGENVRYIPLHAYGDVNHKDCENGVVSSKNHLYVFVLYIRSGILQATAAATDPSQLIKY